MGEGLPVQTQLYETIGGGRATNWYRHSFMRPLVGEGLPVQTQIYETIGGGRATSTDAAL